VYAVTSVIRVAIAFRKTAAHLDATTKTKKSTIAEIDARPNAPGPSKMRVVNSLACSFVVHQLVRARKASIARLMVVASFYNSVRTSAAITNFTILADARAKTLVGFSFLVNRIDAQQFAKAKEPVTAKKVSTATLKENACSPINVSNAVARMNNWSSALFQSNAVRLAIRRRSTIVASTTSNATVVLAAFASKDSSAGGTEPASARSIAITARIDSNVAFCVGASTF